MTALLAALALLINVLGLPAAPARAADVEPILEAKALGGQYFFRGRAASVGGNASTLAAVAVRLGRWTVIPSASSSYQGTKQVVELVGGGTLFQERQAHRAAVRGVYEAGARWRLKPFAAARWELLKETRDERWGRGLFDHRQLELGAEAEYLWREPHALRATAGFFDTRFGNYDALSTRGAAAALGLSRPGAGKRLLDGRSVYASAALEVPLGDGPTLEGGLSEVYSRFPEQFVVGTSGELTSRPREDLLTTASLSARAPFALRADARGALELAASWAHRGSTQNGYDASRGKFIRLAENWTEWRVGPSARALFGPSRRPKQLWASLDLSLRKHPHRPAQNALGAYTGAPLSLTSLRLGAGGSWPVTERVAFVASADWTRGSSNQSFEAAYAYRYTAANYLFGFSFEY